MSIKITNLFSKVLKLKLSDLISLNYVQQPGSKRNNSCGGKKIINFQEKTNIIMKFKLGQHTFPSDRYSRKVYKMVDIDPG